MSQLSFNNYDSEQYQILMANFQHLIQTTQDKLYQQKQSANPQQILNRPKEQSIVSEERSKPSSPQKDQYIEKLYSQSMVQSRMKMQRDAIPFGGQSYSPSKLEIIQPSYQCCCGMEETVKQQDKEIQELKVRIELMKPLELNQLAMQVESRPTLHQEYLQDLLAELQNKEEQIKQLTHQNQMLKNASEQLKFQHDSELNSHRQTQLKLAQLQQHFDQIREELHLIEEREFQISDKLTKEYSDLVIENIQHKEKHEHLLQQLNKYQIALNQLSLNQRQEHKLVVNTQCQTDEAGLHHKKQSRQNDDSVYDLKKGNRSESFNQSVLNTSILKENNEDLKGRNMRQVLREKIDKASNNTEKFILLFVEQKKIKNRSQNEVKFYTELGKMLHHLKENYGQLTDAFNNYTSEQDIKEEQMRMVLEQTLENVRILKENTQNEIQNLHEQLALKDTQQEQIQTRLNQSQDQLQALKKQIVENSATINNLTRENRNLNEKVDLLTQEIADKEQDFQHTQTTNNSYKSSLEVQIKNLRAECNELKRLKLQVENELSQLLYSHEEQQQMIQGNLQQNQDLKLELDDKLQKLKVLQDQIRVKTQENQAIMEENEQLSKELSLINQKDQRLNQANLDLQRERQQLHDSVEKVQSQQMELFERHAMLERQCGKLQEENLYLKEQVQDYLFIKQLLQYEDSISYKDQEAGLLQAEIHNMHSRLDQLNQERDQYQEQLLRTQEDKTKLGMMLKSNEQSLREKSSELDRYYGESTYKSQRIANLESNLRDLFQEDLLNTSQQNMELQSAMQATDQELRMLQDYHDKTLNNMEKLKVQLANLQQIVKDRELQIVELEKALRNQENKYEKDKAGLHADYQQKYGMFQSKIMIQEDQIKELEIIVADLQGQLGFQKQTTEKGGNWEELLETSYYYNKQSQIKLKVLTQETQRLNNQIEKMRLKIKDLETFIERMIEYSEDNRILAKQILVEQYEKGRRDQSYSKQMSEQFQKPHDFEDEQQADQFYNSADTFGQNESSQTEFYEFKTPAKGRYKD